MKLSEKVEQEKMMTGTGNKLTRGTPLLLFMVFNHHTVLAQDTSAELLLREHSNEFRQEIIKITDDVYMASGYGASNSAMIVGESGLIIIDTKESKSAARTVLEEFRAISDKPIKAIIYTHGHVDHTNGTTEFVGDNELEIYARASFRDNLMPDSDLNPIIFARTGRQFGFRLDSEEFINMGTAERPIRDEEGDGYLPPTVTFDEERIEITIEGVDLELVAAPGETDDQLYVWLPEKRVLFPGDNIYKAFPNLYPIRGAMYRDVKVWAESLEKMRLEGAEYLVPGHSRPILGEEQVDEALRDYASAIRYVYDETIEGMNDGMTANLLAESIALPDELAESPFLTEFYGMVPWGVKSVFYGKIGWFDGNPTTLLPLSEREQAERIIGLGGGADNIFMELQDALASEDYQWAMQLADYLLATEYRTAESTEIKIQALRGVARQQINPTARNYYFSFANELAQR